LELTCISHFDEGNTIEDVESRKRDSDTGLLVLLELFLLMLLLLELVMVGLWVGV
jgi:hypothetical protein